MAAFLIDLTTIQTPNLIQRTDFSSAGQLNYRGWASAGVATSAASWKIIKYTYDATGNLTGTGFAGGSASFNQIWDNRASLSYS